MDSKQSYISFEDYWTRNGSRHQVASHEERAQLAWAACERSLEEVLRRSAQCDRITWLNQKENNEFTDNLRLA